MKVTAKCPQGLLTEVRAIPAARASMPVEHKQQVPSCTQRPLYTQPMILSVDDDDDLRYLMGVTLGFMGFQVVSCPDAETASRAFRTGLAIDLLITDLEMPGRSGLELARELCALAPAMPVLIVSGAYFSVPIQQEVQKNSWRFLAKPYAVPDFAAGIHDLLGRNGQQLAVSA